MNIIRVFGFPGKQLLAIKGDIREISESINLNYSIKTIDVPSEMLRHKLKSIPAIKINGSAFYPNQQTSKNEIKNFLIQNVNDSYYETK